MVQYDIYIGGKNDAHGERQSESDIRAWADQHFDGYTLIPVAGRWDRVSEETWVVRVIGAGESDIRVAALDAKSLFAQSAILVTKAMIESSLL